jgi:hypothetical protein
VGGADGHLPGSIVGVMAPALLDSGVYDATEVGHLLAVRAECIVRWAAPDSQGRPPVVDPSFGRAYSFVDLVSLAGNS